MKTRKVKEYEKWIWETLLDIAPGTKEISDILGWVRGIEDEYKANKDQFLLGTVCFVSGCVIGSLPIFIVFL